MVEVAVVEGQTSAASCLGEVVAAVAAVVVAVGMMMSLVISLCAGATLSSLVSQISSSPNQCSSRARSPHQTISIKALLVIVG